MNSKINLSCKKSNFTISSILKPNNNKKNFSSRSNTQEMTHYNRSKNKSSSCKYKKNKNPNNSLYNNKIKKEELIGKMANISTKMNSGISSKVNTTKSEYKNLNIYQYKEIINQKDKKIIELEKQIKLYKDKLKNQMRIFNINTSINSFNLSKTRSSTNITERNIYQIRSLSNSQAKIKNSYPISKNIYGNKITDNKMNYYASKNKNRKRPKTNNYKKPKINNYFFGNQNNENRIHVNNFKRNEKNSKQKYKYKDNSMKYKRAKSSNIEKNKKFNNNMIKLANKNCNNNEELLTIEQTMNLCEKMMEKMKNVLELVKAATIGD